MVTRRASLPGTVQVYFILSPVPSSLKGHEMTRTVEFISVRVQYQPQKVFMKFSQIPSCAVTLSPAIPALNNVQGLEHSHISGAGQNRPEIAEVTVHVPVVPTVQIPPGSGSNVLQPVVIGPALEHKINNNNGNAYGKTTSPTLSSILSGSSLPTGHLDVNDTATSVSDGDTTTQPVPILTGVLCYDEGPLIVQKNMPCEGKGLRKANLTGQTLVQLLRNEGGGLIGDLVSLEPPKYLRDFDLQSLEHFSWLNQNKTDIILNLQEMLHNQKQNQNSIKQNIRQYLSMGGLTNIMEMAFSLIEALNGGFTINICASNSNSNDSSGDSPDASSCVILVAEIANLRSIHAHLQGVLSQPSVNIPSVQAENSNSLWDATGENTSQNGPMLNAEMDHKIEDLLKKLKALQQYCKTVMMLHSRLLNSTVSFHQALLAVESEIFREIVQLSLNSSTTMDNTSGSESVLGNTSFSLLNNSIIETGSKLDESLRNLTVVVELLNHLKTNLTQFKTLLSTVDLTWPEDDPRVSTWTTWSSLNQRTKRSITGFSVTSEICQRQGSLINQTNYVSLCTTCVHTTVLDNNYFPRYLTEKVCGLGSSSNPNYQSGCLNLPGQTTGGPGGLCQQQQIHIVVLRKTPGRCMKIRSQGREIITDQWESTTHPLRVGCECVINQNSPFAKFAVFP
ncbi:hypothetical protein Btru_004292 [Bulinus truncatus]|nr:hypothetical protein Btru_004292 [Bulinus truncatus]